MDAPRGDSALGTRSSESFCRETHGSQITVEVVSWMLVHRSVGTVLARRKIENPSPGYGSHQR